MKDFEPRHAPEEGVPTFGSNCRDVFLPVSVEWTVYTNTTDFSIDFQPWPQTENEQMGA